MRPAFEIPLRVPPQDFLAALHKRLQDKDIDVDGSILRAGAELHTSPSRQHFWSPTLSVELVGDEGSTTLRARFAPSPSVWMLFIGVYGILAMLGLAALMFGLSELLLGERPVALLGVPVAAALAAFVYGAVFIGQGLGAEEMHLQRSVVERAVEDASDAVREAGSTPDDAQG